MGHDDLSAPPAISQWTSWLLGLLGPACLAVYAISCLLKRAAYLPGSRGSGVTVTGGLAMWLAGAYLSAAAIAHFHLFWGSQAGLCRYRSVFVLISLLAFCGCLGVFMFEFMKA